VREDGALLYGFQPEWSSGWHFQRVYEFGIRAAHGPRSVTQTTESPRFPCVVTTLDYAKASLELKAFAHRQGDRRMDVVLWTLRLHEDVPAFLTGFTINIYEQNRIFMGRSLAPARVIFAVDPQQKPIFDESVVAFSYQEEDESHPGPGEVAFISTPHRLIPAHPAGFRPCSALATEPAVLRAGETLRGAIIIPQNFQDETHFDLDWAEQAYAEAKAYWQDMPLLNLPIQLPDPAVMAMLESCARNILQAREIKDGLPTFQVGPTCYRGLWVVDGHFLLEAAHYLGFGNDAYTGLNALLQHVRPDGAITIIPFHTKETGISLFTLVRQCELMGDDERLRALWRIIQNAVSYIERLRQEACALPPDSPCCRLLPMSFADGGLGGLRGEYTTVFWILAGLKAVAAAAARLGLSEDTARFQADFDSLLADFRRHAARNMQTLPDGTPYLPMKMPGSSDHLYIPNYPKEVPDYIKVSPASATWAMCHAIYPGEVFPPEDPLVQNLLRLYDLIDDHEGIPAFTGWIPYQALWNYNASFGAHVWLYAGRGDKAVDYLYDFANHASPTRVWREEQSFADSEEGQMVGDMPHNWASAEFIRLVRHLVIFERGDSLELLAGVPQSWRKPGDVICFERTPTRFGPVTLRLETFADNHFTLNLSLDPNWKHQPVSLRVRLPASVVTDKDGKTLLADQGDWFVLPCQRMTTIHGKWNIAGNG